MSDEEGYYSATAAFTNDPPIPSITSATNTSPIAHKDQSSLNPGIANSAQHSINKENRTSPDTNTGQNKQKIEPCVQEEERSKPNEDTQISSPKANDTADENDIRVTNPEAKNTQSANQVDNPLRRKGDVVVEIAEGVTCNNNTNSNRDEHSVNRTIEQPDACEVNGVETVGQTLARNDSVVDAEVCDLTKEVPIIIQNTLSHSFKELEESPVIVRPPNFLPMGNTPTRDKDSKNEVKGCCVLRSPKGRRKARENDDSRGVEREQHGLGGIEGDVTQHADVSSTNAQESNDGRVKKTPPNGVVTFDDQNSNMGSETSADEYFEIENPDDYLEQRSQSMFCDYGGVGCDRLSYLQKSVDKEKADKEGSDNVSPKDQTPSQGSKTAMSEKTQCPNIEKHHIDRQDEGFSGKSHDQIMEPTAPDREVKSVYTTESEYSSESLKKSQYDNVSDTPTKKEVQVEVHRGNSSERNDDVSQPDIVNEEIIHCESRPQAQSMPRQHELDSMFDRILEPLRIECPPTDLLATHSIGGQRDSTGLPESSPDSSIGSGSPNRRRTTTESSEGELSTPSGDAVTNADIFAQTDSDCSGALTPNNTLRRENKPLLRDRPDSIEENDMRNGAEENCPELEELQAVLQKSDGQTLDDVTSGVTLRSPDLLSNGRASRSSTCYSRTESDLSISEHRDDVSTDGILADDEDECEVLLCKTYTEPKQGTEVLLSCTIVNSAYKDGRRGDYWSSADDVDFRLFENSTDLLEESGSTDTYKDARLKMKDIQVHLQNLRVQMEQLNEDLLSMSSDEEYLSVTN